MPSPEKFQGRNSREVEPKFSESFVGQYFERDVALQFAVPRTIHLAHAARANGREDFIGSQTSPSRESHRMLADSIPPRIAGQRIRPEKSGFTPRFI